MIPDLDIIAMGSVAMDYYLILDGLPRNDEKVRARSARFLPGGTMGNFACAAAKLGARTGFVGVVGNDAFGDLLIQDFKGFGVDTSHVLRRPGEGTPLTVLIVSPGGERTNLLPPFIHLNLEDIDREYLSNTKILHTHLFDIGVLKSCAEEARKNYITFSIDLELHRVKHVPSSDLREMLALCDLVFLNQETLIWMAQSSYVQEAATRLIGLGAKTVIVTLGQQGSLAVSHEEAAWMVPFKVNAVDATGAGDCFAAAFCYGYLQRWSLRETMMFASAASALAVTKTGARTALATAKEVSCFLRGSSRVDFP